MAPAPARRRRRGGTFVTTTVALGLALGAVVMAMALGDHASSSDVTGSVSGAGRPEAGSCGEDWPPKEACLQALRARSGLEAPVRGAGENVTAEEHHAPAIIEPGPDAASVAPEPAAPGQAASADPAAEMPPKEAGTAQRLGRGAPRHARPASPPVWVQPTFANRVIVSDGNER